MRSGRCRSRTCRGSTRIALGRPFGVVVLAEGIGLRLPQDELAQAMPEVERNEHGRVRLAEL